MYNIITKQKNNKTLYTVVFVTHQLSLPMCQSYNYDKCLEYIDMKEQSEELYNECNFQRYNDNKSWYYVISHLQSKHD